MRAPEKTDAIIVQVSFTRKGRKEDGNQASKKDGFGLNTWSTKNTKTAGAAECSIRGKKGTERCWRLSDQKKKKDTQKPGKER